MKFEELQGIANGMSVEEAADTLRELMKDRRSAALVRLMQQQKDFASDHSASLQFANNPGCLAHAAGVRYGMLELEGKLREACLPKKRKAAPPPESAE